MISLTSKNIKKFHCELLKYLENYTYVKIWYKEGYHATLTWYRYHPSCIHIPMGNKFFKLGTILHHLGCSEKTNFIMNLGKLIKGDNNGKRCQNGSDIQQELLF